ncbi:hypothetical protein Z946_4076 [Sulfitobacter noctilucicola]|uniref:Uncharacterized protein YjiS (DUF1127 family) n=1 Tax=Sulfitobacter noctilucicola TaxID=1342301 RepID=A0A7W6Q324_9RHOB|nr:DUF1127 domain-containing protein [Sulfitobacter noctilucicola]KIN65176.1 hypothetical protein Z946_4076 [Sulfitobacter noctilucicola]MBB4173690.1 uncharacterized protein YjiS (DUF1127 family) [Sulfitobacter noctilucicola]
MTHARLIQTDTFSIQTRPGTPVAAVIAVKFAILVTKWAARRQTRLALAQLEPWQLADVGLTPDEAITESRRVFWQM